MNYRKTRKTRKSRKTRVNKLNVRNRTRRRGRGKRHHRGSGGNFSRLVGPALSTQRSFNANQARREEEEAAAAAAAAAAAERKRVEEAYWEARRCPKCRKLADETVRLLNDRNLRPEAKNEIYGYVGFIPEHVTDAEENRLIRMYKEMDAAKAAERKPARRRRRRRRRKRS